MKPIIDLKTLNFIPDLSIPHRSFQSPHHLQSHLPPYLFDLLSYESCYLKLVLPVFFYSKDSKHGFDSHSYFLLYFLPEIIATAMIYLLALIMVHSASSNQST